MLKTLTVFCIFHHLPTSSCRNFNFSKTIPCAGILFSVIFKNHNFLKKFWWFWFFIILIFLKIKILLRWTPGPPQLCSPPSDVSSRASQRKIIGGVRGFNLKNLFSKFFQNTSVSKFSNVRVELEKVCWPPSHTSGQRGVSDGGSRDWVCLSFEHDDNFDKIIKIVILSWCLNKIPVHGMINKNQYSCSYSLILTWICELIEHFLSEYFTHLWRGPGVVIDSVTNTSRLKSSLGRSASTVFCWTWGREIWGRNFRFQTYLKSCGASYKNQHIFFCTPQISKNFGRNHCGI